LSKSETLATETKLDIGDAPFLNGQPYQFFAFIQITKPLTFI